MTNSQKIKLISASIILFLLLLAITHPAEGDGGFGYKEFESGLSPGEPKPTATPRPATPLDASYIGTVNPWWPDRDYNTGRCAPQPGFGWSYPLRWPVEGPVHYNRSFSFSHRGVDIDVPFQTPVTAATAGVVTYAGFHLNGYGELVVLSHGYGYHTFYAHLDSVLVTCNQFVPVGQLLGYTGRTGQTTFDHLHFEVRIGSNSHHPLRFLKDRP